jgi:hypothetical protein
MSFRGDMQQNIQIELNFSSTPAGEACEASREETESLPTMNDPQSLLLAQCPFAIDLCHMLKSTTPCLFYF